ncbi:MAG: hypothetical protein B6241_12410 [Spirochaetaceae bacterium 4572_59]|nr:MAG: hypothetical protein B6241_12410 [Spirochaetaceae bacterium 4572_59]
MAFKRKVICQIGTPGEPGIEITDLKILFEVKKTEKESLNEALVKIYNLSDHTISKISGKNKALVLRAGYEDEGVKGLFFGSIKDIKTGSSSPDRETIITAFDGFKNGKEKVISVSYKPGVSRKAVFQDLIQALGLPVQGTDLISGSFSGGFSFIGKVTAALEKVVKAVGGICWTIQNETYLVYEKEKPASVTGLFLSSSTGLIGSPEDISEEPEGEGEAVKRYRVTSFLFPEIIPRGRIKVLSKKLNGFFKVESVVFSGSNRRDNFQAIAEISPV